MNNLFETTTLSHNKVEKETVPLEAVHGRHSSGVDLNHIKFHLHQIVLLEEEQLQREKLCWFHKMKVLMKNLKPSDITLKNRKKKKKKKCFKIFGRAAYKEANHPVNDLQLSSCIKGDH
jgi:hypothetical protein